MLVKNIGFNKKYAQKMASEKQQSAVNKCNFFCEHCKKRDRLKQGCFEITGFLDWNRDMQKARQLTCGKPWNSSLTVKVAPKQMVCNIAFENKDMFASISELIKKEVSVLCKIRK